MTTKSKAKRIYDVISEDGKYSYIVWHMSRTSASGTAYDAHVKGFATCWAAETAVREFVAAQGWKSERF